MLDKIYFGAKSWKERVADWIATKSTADFDRAQIEIIVDTLSKEDLAPRCVMNIGADALLKFLAGGKYKNTYDLEKDARNTSLPFPLVGGKHEVSAKRKFVDELIGFAGEDAEKLYFGAVALSGSGIRFYGEYCLVLSEKLVQDRNPRVLDRNSYDLIHEPLASKVATVPLGDQIQIEWLRTRWNEQLNDMLAMRIAPTIESPHRLVTPGAVAEGVLADEDYAEVHLEETFGPDDLDEIRFAPEEQSLASDIRGRIDRGSLPDPAEWLWVWRRALVTRACDRKELRCRVTTAAGRTRRWQ